MNRLQSQRHQSLTDENYLAIWRVFNKFFIRLDNKPDHWEDQLALFIAHKINEEGHSKSVMSYISAIKSVLQSEGIFLEDYSYRLSALISACKVHNDVLTVCLPIRRKLMNMILDKIQQWFIDEGQLYLAKLYRAMVAIAYYGLLRVGEITSGTRPIFACDVFVVKNKDKFQLVLRSSKTHTRAN